MNHLSVSEILAVSVCIWLLVREFLRIGNVVGNSVIWENSSVSQHETVLRWGTSGSAGTETNEARSSAGLHLRPTDFSVSEGASAC